MIRMIGAALVVLSSGAVGFGFARAVKLQCAQLEGLLWALDTMQSEMSARLTPLAQLFSGLSACRQKDVAAFFCGSRKGAVCAALLHGAGLLQTGLSAGEGLSPGRRECAGALRAFPEPRKVRSGIAACRNRTDEGKRHGGAVSPAGAEACAVQKL